MDSWAIRDPGPASSFHANLQGTCPLSTHLPGSLVLYPRPPILGLVTPVFCTVASWQFIPLGTQGVTSINGHQSLLKCHRRGLGNSSRLEGLYLVLWDELGPLSNSYVEVLIPGTSECDSIWRRGVFKEVIKMRSLRWVPIQYDW